MFRSSDRRGELIEDNLATLTQQAEDQSDDDNAAPEMQSEAEMEEKEDPLLSAIDNLEGRVASALEDVQLHPGVRSGPEQTVQEELTVLLRPVLEVAAHTAPSVARTYYRGIGSEGVEASCEDVYQRVVSDLVLPVILEMAQSDTVPAKRGASLEFFRQLWGECHKPGSWLDPGTGMNAGPYGSGQVGKLHHNQQQQQPRPVWKRRQVKRLAREGEILRYWVQASIACTTPGVFTNAAAEASIAARGVIAASASIRPSLKHIAQRIRDTDDRGANRVYGPVMKMVEGVLKKLFLSSESQGDALCSSCVKFLEIVCLCCSTKPQDASQRRRANTPDDFSLEDLPAGHPVITREALESIGEYAFSALRGLTLLGGQVKIDVNLLSDMMMGSENTPSAQVVSILKPAALAFLEVASTLSPSDDDNALDFDLDRENLEFDFTLSPKSYSLTINAVAAISTNRPMFFQEGAICLARRAADPPTYTEDGTMPKNAVLAVQSHIKASCLTLLRNSLSVQTQSATILHKCLSEKCDMEVQADKALKMAQQAHDLKTAGRAARNRANMFYEWDNTTDQRTTKRQRETDDDLAKLRAARASRGLGHGIQLPTSMVDSMELVLTNLKHLPTKRPTTAAAKRKTPITLDFVVDAVLTNGASLAQEEGRWYARDGGSAWELSDGKFELSSKLLATTSMDVDPSSKPEPAKDQKQIFHSQCNTAAAEAVGRIVLNGQASRNGNLAEFANNMAARLAWTLKGVPASSHLQPAHDMAMDTIQSAKKRITDTGKQQALDQLAGSYPLVTSCLALEASTTANHENDGHGSTSLSNSVLNEAYAQDFTTADGTQGTQPSKFQTSLDLYAGTVLHSSERANDKATDNDRKRIATTLTSRLQKDVGILPSVTSSGLELVSAMCDLDEITKKTADAARKQSQQSIAVSAALHASKQAAEKRATIALLVLRDTAFQRSDRATREGAVRTAVALASGQFNASSSCEDKALKLVMNVLFARSQDLANAVVEAAVAELTIASDYAVENYAKIKKANKEAAANDAANQPKVPLGPESEEEKAAMERVRKPAVLLMALCIRRPEIIKTLFELCSVPQADVLSKAVRQQMPRLARAAGTTHGTAEIALKVAGMAGEAETPLLLAFLDNLSPTGEKGIPPQDFIDACYKIQEEKAIDGKKDSRFLIPVASAMNREDLIDKLPGFVAADDGIFMAALVKMAERLGRQALLFRDEPEADAPALKGLTACEQLVFLHKLDFLKAGLPQKRYLDAVRLCLDNEEIFTDNLIMSALDHMSGTFLTGSEKLPLAYMRTIILVCSKHESLHSWICHTLLPRLVEGKIYEDRRQWEGWMRCAKILENSSDTGVSSRDAVSRLPPEQLAMYQARYGS